MLVLEGLLHPAHNALAKSLRNECKFKVRHSRHLSGPIFTAYVSESAQHPCPSPWTSHLGHSIFSLPLQVPPDPRCTEELEVKI